MGALINLTTVGNLAGFTGAVAVNNSGATGNASLTNGAALTFATSTVGGNLTAVSRGGHITAEAGAITVGGRGKASPPALGALINLTTVGNLAVAATGAVAVNNSGATGNVSLTNGAALVLAASSVGRAL